MNGGDGVRMSGPCCEAGSGGDGGDGSCDNRARFGSGGDNDGEAERFIDTAAATSYSCGELPLPLPLLPPGVQYVNMDCCTGMRFDGVCAIAASNQQRRTPNNERTRDRKGAETSEEIVPGKECFPGMEYC